MSSVNKAAADHALASFPNESCGVIVDELYVPCENLADDPLNSFKLPETAMIGATAVIHSHIAPQHEQWPTANDMRSQQQTAVPWGIILTDHETASEPLWFGDFTLDQPLLGRDFKPGVYDCYALVRAWYWQERGVKLPEFPRDNNWWARGEDLLREGAPNAGFLPKPIDDLEEGDMFFMNILGPVPNHCGIVLKNGLILHHLGGRLSRREPLGPWVRYITNGFYHVA